MTSDLESFLNYYVSQSEPGYAVLVTGPWGVGKTHQVRAALGKKHHYVSVFGAQSAEEMHAAVFAAINPSGAAARRATDRLVELSKALKGLIPGAGLAAVTPSIVSAIFRREIELEHPLVFDDLERCGVPEKERLHVLLGVLNEYVERQRGRVIILAHDDKLAAEFQGLKEKVVGRTLRVRPQTDEAFAAFVERLESSQAKEFVTARKARILDIFKAAGVESLRVLRHVVEDLGRLHNILESRHLHHTEALDELVAIFVALNTEVRVGALNERDLKDRPQLLTAITIARMARVNREETDPPSPIIAATERHPDVLESGFLADGLDIEMLLYGRYDAVRLSNALDTHPSFAPPGDVPPWKVVINFDSMSETDVEGAAENMQTQFENREITVPGEILHVCCLRMMMAQEGLLDAAPEQVETENLQYISDLLATGALPARSLHWRWWDSFEQAYGGYGYWKGKEDQDWFLKLWDHLFASMEQALEKTFPDHSAHLLALARGDARQFAREVCQIPDAESSFALIPVLRVIEPETFVTEWLAGENANRRFVSYALEERYAGDRLKEELKEERVWVAEVLHILEECVEAAEGFEALRIRRLTPHKLKARLAEDQPEA